MQQWLIVLIVAPFLLGMLGGVVQRMILGPKPHATKDYFGWRKWYLVTIPWHYLIAGCAVGAVGHSFGIPRPDAFGSELAGAMLAYSFAGAVSIVAYDTIVKVIKRAIEAIRLP